MGCSKLMFQAQVAFEKRSFKASINHYSEVLNLEKGEVLKEMMAKVYVLLHQLEQKSSKVLLFSQPDFQKCAVKRKMKSKSKRRGDCCSCSAASAEKGNSIKAHLKNGVVNPFLQYVLNSNERNISLWGHKGSRSFWLHQTYHKALCRCHKVCIFPAVYRKPMGTFRSTLDAPYLPWLLFVHAFRASGWCPKIF